MKAYKVVYKHGHFIDVESGQRLIPVQGAEYTISAADKAFKSEDAKLKMGDALNSKDKAEHVEKEYGKGNYAKIMNTDEQLFFRVGNSRKAEGDENHQYIFVCTLLEDLYLYLLKGKKGDDVEDWRLEDCKCVLEKCLLGGLTLTEKIHAESLNKLFSQTVMFYFSMQRSGSANAFNTYFKYNPDMKITFEETTYLCYDGLAKARKDFVVTRRKK
ncbi:MAG: hypothetical protein KG003_12060 [Bacteroidetes bacterium]|nr:hypothetical protein [Bacteroidota bacterium]